MPTSTKTRTTIELNLGDKERLQNIALSLGLIQSTGPEAGKVGSISQLMQSLPISTQSGTAIRRLAADFGLSQSEVVDKAMQAFELLSKLLWDKDNGYVSFTTNYPVNMQELFEELESWKENQK